MLLGSRYAKEPKKAPECEAFSGDFLQDYIWCIALFDVFLAPTMSFGQNEWPCPWTSMRRYHLTMVVGRYDVV